MSVSADQKSRCCGEFFSRQLPGDDGLLFVVQPRRLGRAIGQEFQHRQGKKDSGRAFNQEQPLPAMQAANALHAQNEAGKRTAHDIRRRQRRHEQSHDAGAIRPGEPIGHVKDHAGIKAGLDQAQKHAHCIETVRPRDGGIRCRQRAPGQEDQEYPALRTHLFEDRVGGHLEQRVAQKENAGAETIDRRAEAQIVVHGERGKAHIHPVHDVDEIEQRHQRHQPPGAFAENPVCCHAAPTCSHDPATTVSSSVYRSLRRGQFVPEMRLSRMLMHEVGNRLDRVAPRAGRKEKHFDWQFRRVGDYAAFVPPVRSQATP